MLVRELIERITSIYHQGARNVFTRLSNRRIYSIANTSRALLLMQMANKKQFLSPFNYSTLSCVELMTVDKSTCPCAVPTLCNVLRSVHKLPKILNSLNGLLIQNVTLTDGTLINKSTVNAVKYVLHNKYTGKKPYYFIHDDYLWIVNLNHVEYVSIVCMFEDVISDKNLFKCDSEKPDFCVYTPLDEEFVIDEYLVNTVIQMTIQEISVLQGLKNKNQEDEQQQDNN